MKLKTSLKSVTFGDYVVTKELAPGVWQCTDAQGVIFTARTVDQEHAEFLATLPKSATGLVTYSDGKAFFQWVNGEDYDYRSPLCILQLTCVLKQLHELHKQGVCHGDVSPHNVVVNGESGRLIDFGRAAFFGTAGYAGSYSAPELWSKSTSQASDQFSVGLMAVEYVIQKKIGWFGALSYAFFDHPSLPSVIRRMLAPEPEARYASCEEASEALAIAASSIQIVRD